MYDSKKIISTSVLYLLLSQVAQSKEYGLTCMNMVSDDLVVIAKVASNLNDAYLQTAQHHIKKGYTDKFKFVKLKLNISVTKYIDSPIYVYDIANNVEGLRVFETTDKARLLYDKTEYSDCKALNKKEIDRFMAEGKAQTSIANIRLE